MEKLKIEMQNFPNIKINKYEGKYEQDQSITIWTKIEYDLDKIASELRKDYSKAIDTIIYSWVNENKKDIIEEIFEDILFNILKKLEKERKKLKKHIMR